MSGTTAFSRQFSYAAARLALVGAVLLGAWLVLVPQARGAEALLPNLVADPPAGISLETSTTEGGLKKEATPQLLLRFNGYIHNLGPGPVDFRGSRSSSSEPMKAFQRVYSSDGSFKEEPSSAELVYATADGHEHWHLQRAAKYSLWNLAKSAEVAPAMKVGFCLDDSEHVESAVGPKEPVYSDATGREFCRQHQPEATSLFEGISAGWRDLYSSNLAFQWVDASSVLPGEYFLREDVNTTGVIKETGGANTPAYTTSPVVIPGFNALAQSATAQAGTAQTLTLTSKAFKDTATPTYKIVSGPAHGTLGAVSKNQVTYTPAAGYTGPDSFTFAAADPSSPFPRSPATATVSIEVGAATGKGLLAGDGTSSYAVGDQTTAGREEAFQFTAKASGTIEELQFRTNGTANTGVTGLVLGILAENAGKPGEVLASGAASGEPAINSWIKVSGLSRSLVGGTKYWLVALPLGPSTARLHYNAAVASGGTGNVESTAGGLTAMSAQSSWETYNQGPVGFQAIGSSGVAEASVTIEGAPASMTAGSSVQLTAHVVNDSSTVTWKASAGSITTGGLYTAPSEPPAGGSVTITATTSKGATAQRTIQITPVAEASVTIEGAPASMTASASVQLTAHVVNDSSTVTWKASAGSITTGGLYTAPSEPPAGGSVTITATTSKGATAQRTIQITPVAEASVTIEGAPASMTAGASVQLTAHVVNDSSTVTWKASAGSITTGGLYTAPAEPPVGGKATITVTTAKGAHDERTIEILAATSKGLLTGDATSTYTVADVTTAGREEAFQFTAKASGTVEELQFRTNGVANTGVTGVVLGLLAESGGKPGEVLASASVSGLPAINSWIKVGGLAKAIVSGTKYWLVALPLGPSSAKLHFNAAVGSGGAGNLESVTGGLSTMTAQASWEAYNQGPVGFQALGTISGAASIAEPAVRLAARPAAAAPSAAAAPGVAIEGAPGSIVAGTSVQLAAAAQEGAPAVAWHASAGTITRHGLYTAPLHAPRGAMVHISAGRGGAASDERTIKILPVPIAQAAPAAQFALPGTVQPGAPVPRLATPQALLVGRKLVLSTRTARAGVVTLTAFIGKRRLGGCSARTPGNRGFTCRLELAGLPAYSSIGVRATLRSAAGKLSSVRLPAPVAAMSMPSTLGVSLLLHNGASIAQFICSAAAARHTRATS
jgi:hypothetical protein